MNKGKWPFRAVIGYLNAKDAQGQKTFVVDPERADLVREAFEVYATGLYSKEQVRARVTAKGLRTKAGKPLTAERFDKMLRNPRYAGVLDVKKWSAQTKASFPVIVDAELFKRVQDVLTGRSKSVTPRQRNRSEMPVTEFRAMCHCHRPLTGGPSKGKMGIKYFYYNCQNRSCRNRVRAEKFHEQFVTFLRQQQPDSGYLRLFHKIVLDVWNTKQSDAVALARTFEHQIDELKDRKRKLLEAMVYQQTLTRAEYEELRTPLEAELSAADHNLAQARAAEVDVEKVLGFAEDLLLNVAGVWEKCSLDQKQRLQEVVFPQRIGVRRRSLSNSEN